MCIYDSLCYTSVMKRNNPLPWNRHPKTKGRLSTRNWGTGRSSQVMRKRNWSSVHQTLDKTISYSTRIFCQDMMKVRICYYESQNVKADKQQMTGKKVTKLEEMEGEEMKAGKGMWAEKEEDRPERPFSVFFLFWNPVSVAGILIEYIWKWSLHSFISLSVFLGSLKETFLYISGFWSFSCVSWRKKRKTSSIVISLSYSHCLKKEEASFSVFLPHHSSSVGFFLSSCLSSCRVIHALTLYWSDTGRGWSIQVYLRWLLSCL